MANKISLEKAAFIPFATVFIAIAVVILIALSPILEPALQSLVDAPTNNTLIIAVKPSMPWLVGLVYLAIIIAAVAVYYKALQE